MLLKNIKAFYFDLDDTLINFGGVTEMAWEQAVEKMLEKYSEVIVSAEKLTQEILKVNTIYWADDRNHKSGNKSIHDARKGILLEAFTNIGLYKSTEYITFLLDNYPTFKEAAVHILPNVHETLATLKKMNYKLALITNGASGRQREKLERFNLEQYFDFIWISDEQEFSKPDERVYKRVTECLEIDITEACMVGDNYLWEVAAPKQIGLKGIFLNFNNKGLPANYQIEPDIMIENIDELLPYLSTVPR